MSSNCSEQLRDNTEVDKIKNDIDNLTKELESISDEKRKERIEQELFIMKNDLRNLKSLQKKGIRNISDKYDVSFHDLKNQGVPIVIKDDIVYIGDGHGYSSRKTGYSENFGGRIIIGKKEWLTKNAWEIPEVREEVDKIYQDNLSLKGGNFKDKKRVDSQEIISNLLSGYKSPLTAHNTQDIRLISKAYFKNGEVEQKIVNEFLENDVKLIIEDYQKKPSSLYFKRVYEELPEKILKEQINHIKKLKYQSRIFSQQSVNEFYSEILNTQKDLRDRFKGKDTITLYRGVSGGYSEEIKQQIKENNSVKVSTFPLTSWTEKKYVAEDFAGKNGIIIKKEVPIEDIMFSHYTSPYIKTSDFVFGGTEEYEFVVGNKEGILYLSKDEILWKK